MYSVSLFNAGEEIIIHYSCPDKEAPHLPKLNIIEKAGQTTQVTFEIYKNNPGYDLLFDLVTVIKITKNNEELIFEGRVFLSPQTMSGNGDFYKDVSCESEISYFNDTLTRAWSITSMSTRDFISKVILNHNLHTTSDKQFALGNIEVSGLITCTTSFENSLNVLLDKMVNALAVGYLFVRKDNGIRYLDYIYKLPGTSANINLGENMKDILFSKDVTNIGTRIIPKGANNLTIETVNNGIDYLENSSAILEFGIIEQVIDLKDITSALDLKAAGQLALDNAGKGIYKLSTNILDLSTIGLNSSGFFIGTDTNINNEVIGFNETFTIVQKNIDLLNPQNCKITLNDKFETNTDTQLNLERVSKYVQKILSADNQVNTFYLDGYINLLKNQMGAMADTAELQQSKAILFEDKQIGSASYGAMALGTQGFMIASTIVDGDWDWRTFGTGQGFTADLIIAGHIIGGAVDINLNDGYIKIDHIDGSYSLMDSSGFKHYIAGSPYPYLGLVDVGNEIIIKTQQHGDGNSNNWGTVLVQLPASFKGKIAKFSIYFQRYDAVWIHSGHLIIPGLGWQNYNVADATFEIKGYIDHMDETNAKVYGEGIVASYMAVV